MQASWTNHLQTSVLNKNTSIAEKQSSIKEDIRSDQLISGSGIITNVHQLSTGELMLYIYRSDDKIIITPRRAAKMKRV